MDRNIRVNPEKAIVVYAALFLLLVFLAVNNYLWLGLNKISPFWDESRHLAIAISYADVIRHFPAITDTTKLIETIEEFWSIEHPYTPFFHLVSAPLSLIWGNSLEVLAMSNIAFLAILLFSVFKIGEKLFDRRVGLFAAFLTGLSPMAAGTSRMFMLEFAAAGMVCLGIYLLLLTENFRSRNYSLLFGLGFGLGMLTRETFFIFLVAPAAYILYGAFSKPRPAGKRRIITNFMLALAVGSAVWLPFYLRNLSYYSSGFRAKFLTYLARMLLFRNPVVSERMVSLLIFLAIAVLLLRPVRLGIKRYAKVSVLIFLVILNAFAWHDRLAVVKLFWYGYNLKDQLGVPFLALFLACLPNFLRSGKHKAFLFFWILPAYTLFTASFFKDYLVRWQPRFTIPYLPAIALIASSCVLNIKNKKLRTLTVCLTLIFGLIHFFNISFGQPRKNASDNKIIEKLTRPDEANWWLIHRPVRDNYWKVPEILHWIHGDMRETGKEKAVINLIVDTGEINFETFYYYILANRLPFLIFLGEDSQLSMADYIISLSNPQDWHWEFQKDRILGFYDAFKEISGDFVLVKEFEKLDNTLYIYRRKNR